MRKKSLWAGIDLGVETAAVCIIDNDGQILHENKCKGAASDLRHELSMFRRTRFAAVGLEAGSSMHVARGLRSLGYPIELYETRQLSKFLRARRNKTDAGDAKGMAEAARIGATMVSKVYLKPLECQALQARLAIRTHLIRQRIAAVSMLSRQIELFGGRVKGTPGSDAFRSSLKAEISRLFPHGPKELVGQLQFLADHSQNLVSYQRAVDRELKLAAQNIEVCRRFTEIPGVGPLCALTFYATVGDPHRFSSSVRVGSYFGLAPRLHESGLTSRKPRISKMGHKGMRSLLVRAATSYMHYADRNSALHRWTLQLERRRGRGKSRIALARKIAVIMLAMWKSGDRFLLKEGLAVTEPASGVASGAEESPARLAVSEPA